MKSSPVILLSLGLLASAAPSGQSLEAQAITPKDESSSLGSRSEGPSVDREAKAMRLRRHKQALKRLRQRRAADDTDTDTDHDTGYDTDTDTDDDDDHRHVTNTYHSAPSTTSMSRIPRPTTWNRDCHTTDTEWEGERRTSCINRPPSTSTRLLAVNTTPAPPPPTHTSHHGTDTNTDTDTDHEHHHNTITPRPATTVRPTRSGCPPRCRRTTRVRGDGSWTDGDTTDCTSDEEWRRNCETATRTMTSLADVTRVLATGSSVTVAPTPGPANGQPALADHELTAAGPRARPEAIGGAVVLAGLVAAAMVF